ncbi:MAG TPA: histidine kinase N-terminal domain-containing protein [Acidimicrobiales bacterium]
MASLAEIARARTPLTVGQVAHLQRLVASWNMLADFCFSDLLLFVPLEDDSEEFVILGHVRPSTSQTLYRSDLLGESTSDAERPLVGRSMRLGEIIEGEITQAAIRERVRVLCIPVRWHGETIAVLSRESTPSVGRSPGELERTYVEIFNRFARMIAAGQYPFAVEDSDAKESPRVGDGVVVLDRAACVEYASPNAVSALHRVGVHANAEGMRLSEIGLEDEIVRDAYAMEKPVTQEVERGDVTVMVRCIPMLDGNGVAGAVVLFRDITEVRRRDRLLLSKDATIREIHHRVKNNLQTISSLLRLQGRRTATADAKEAIAESVRRISSIALVHETLSREAGEDVPFVEILRPLVRMVEEAVSSPDRHVRFVVEGDAGTLQAGIVTPMAVVLTELLQNAVDHAFSEDAPGDDDTNLVRIELANDGMELVIRVIDNGVGLPEDFSVDRAGGLGLSIVRALVTSDLRGTIDMFEPPDGSAGTIVELRLPVDQAP